MLVSRLRKPTVHVPLLLRKPRPTSLHRGVLGSVRYHGLRSVDNSLVRLVPIVTAFAAIVLIISRLDLNHKFGLAARSVTDFC